MKSVALLLAVVFLQGVFSSPTLRAIPSGSVGRIVDGKNATAGQFPYVVSIRYHDFGTTYQHFCGGTIITNRWVVTAAHCTIGNGPKDLFVIASSYRLSAGTVYALSRINQHPAYNKETLFNDISLVQTTNTMVFDQFTQAIPLINRQVTSGELIGSGWGRLWAPWGDVPDILQYIEFRPVSYNDCIKDVPINPDTFCAFNSAGRGLCMGDSGGSLVLPGEGIVGVNSFIMNTCGGGFPDGFSSIFYHRDWILSVIN